MAATRRIPELLSNVEHIQVSFNQKLDFVTIIFEQIQHRAWEDHVRRACLHARREQP